MALPAPASVSSPPPQHSNTISNIQMHNNHVSHYHNVKTTHSISGFLLSKPTHTLCFGSTGLFYEVTPGTACPKRKLFGIVVAGLFYAGWMPSLSPNQYHESPTDEHNQLTVNVSLRRASQVSYFLSHTCTHSTFVQLVYFAKLLQVWPVSKKKLIRIIVAHLITQAGCPSCLPAEKHNHLLLVLFHIK